ncbi:MAG: hypothetical protein QOD42_3221 [Sphingomonadales bacterium]|jgi:hypothetical protein|nr:hypothetical protein [Sphingomonadales bacterium]
MALGHGIMRAMGRFEFAFLFSHRRPGAHWRRWG